MTQFNLELGNIDTGELSESDPVPVPDSSSTGSAPSLKHTGSFVREPSVSRNLSFDDDVDRDSFSKNIGFSIDNYSNTDIVDSVEVSWFDKLYDIITGALDSDTETVTDEPGNVHKTTNYYLKSAAESASDVSYLPLGKLLFWKFYGADFLYTHSLSA